jgi:hypothetical protein
MLRRIAMPISCRTIAILLALAAVGRAGTIVLKRAWIEQYKDRATIDASFTIDLAHPEPNPPSQDGDLHVAGRAPNEIGLPMVAEIMNAADPSEQEAVKFVHSNQGNGQFIAVSGAWRIWFEHPPASGSQIQFADVPPATDTNPDHCFEIHPLTKIGSANLTASLHNISGFTYKPAAEAFGSYEKLPLTLLSNDTAVTLTSEKSGYNYVMFTIRVASSKTALKDGGMAVVADVLPEGEDDASALASKVRMIFIAGTTPFQKASQSLQIGDELHVVGIPRVNLNAISSFLSAAGNGTVTRKLPYEMIIVALEGQATAGGRPAEQKQ